MFYPYTFPVAHSPFLSETITMRLLSLALILTAGSFSFADDKKDDNIRAARRSALTCPGRRGILSE